jgi:hypothetical protein
MGNTNLVKGENDPCERKFITQARTEGNQVEMILVRFQPEFQKIG